MAHRHHPPPPRPWRRAPIAALIAAALAAPALAQAPIQNASSTPDAVRGAPAHLAGGAGPLQLFSTRADLLTAAADIPLTHEDFSNALLSTFSVGSCFQAVAEESNDPCFGPGGLQPGINIRTGGGDIFFQYVALLGESILGTQTKVIGADAITSPQNQTRIDFDPYTTVVGMDVYDGMQAQEVQVWVYDANEALIGTFTVLPEGVNLPGFAGFISPVPVRRVELDAITEGGGELIGRLVWGGGPGRIGTDDSTVDFGVIAAGAQAEAEVTLVNAGHLDLIVPSVPAPAAPFHVLADDCSGATLPMAAQCIITYGFAPQHEGTFQRRVDLGDGNRVRLKAQARGPRLTTMPGHLDFGSVAPGSTSGAQTLTVANLTGAEVASTAALVVAPPFVRTGGNCDSSPFALAPGDACTLELAFAPLHAGDFDADLVLPGGADSLGKATLFGRADKALGGGL